MGAVVSKLRIAYFVNQYPKVSHTFIRREIHALERQGFAIQRIALRGWDADLVDAEDVKERERTLFVLQSGPASLLMAVLNVLVTRPIRLLLALQLAFKMGVRADRPLFFHLVYLAEACRIIPWMKAFGAQHVHAHFGTSIQFYSSWSGRVRQTGVFGDQREGKPFCVCGGNKFLLS